MASGSEAHRTFEERSFRLSAEKGNSEKRRQLDIFRCGFFCKNVGTVISEYDFVLYKECTEFHMGPDDAMCWNACACSDVRAMIWTGVEVVWMEGVNGIEKAKWDVPDGEVYKYVCQTENNPRISSI